MPCLGEHFSAEREKSLPNLRWVSFGHIELVFLFSFLPFSESLPVGLASLSCLKDNIGCCGVWNGSDCNQTGDSTTFEDGPSLPGTVS